MRKAEEAAFKEAVAKAEWKFFPSDVIGRKPRAVGEIFKAQAFGAVCKFKVTLISESYMMAALAE